VAFTDKEGMKPEVWGDVSVRSRDLVGLFLILSWHATSIAVARLLQSVVDPLERKRVEDVLLTQFFISSNKNKVCIHVGLLRKPGEEETWTLTVRLRLSN